MNRREWIKCIASLPFSMKALAQSTMADAVLKGDSRVQGILDKARSFRSGKNNGLRIFYPKGSMGNLLPCASIFEALTSIKIHLIEASLDEISSQLTLEHRLNRTDPYDVALPPTFSIPDLAASQVITPLNEFAQKHEPAGFLDNSLYNLGDSFLGKFYGYQADGDVYLIFTNQEWLNNPQKQAQYADKFGHALGIPQTWEELDRQLQFFHDPAQDRYGGSLFRTLHYTVWEFWVRLHAKGIWPFDSNMMPQIEQAASVQALRDLIEATKFLAPDVNDNGLFENFKSYGQGNKYCNLGWGGTQKYLQSPDSKLRDKHSSSPIPGGRIGSQSFSMPYFNWGWNYVVLERSSQKELAYLFCLFASTASISTLAVRDRDGYFDPHRREHYEDPSIQSIYGKDFLKAHMDSMQNAIPDLYIQGYNLYMSALKNAIHSCLVHHIKPELALKKVAMRWNELTDKLGREDQINQWRYLQSRYPAFLQKTLR